VRCERLNDLAILRRLLLVVTIVVECAGAEGHQRSNRACIAVDRRCDDTLDERTLLGDRDVAAAFAK